MTIKQHGGIFGRNPKFKDVYAEGTITANGNISSLSEIEGRSLQLVEPSSSRCEINLENSEGSFLIGADGDFALLRSNLFIFQNSGGGDRIDIVGGNLKPQSGNGIDFSATSGTGTSELFDDYEEGLFGVTMAASTSGTVTLDYNTLAYTKIGRVVFVTGEIRVSAVSSPVGDITIQGLPFANSGLSQRSSRTSFFVETNSLTGSPTGIVQGFLTAGGTAIDIRLVDNFSFTSLASYLQTNTGFKIGFAYTAA